MKSLGLYLLIGLTVLGGVQFLSVLNWYLSWRQSVGVPAGPDIGLGFVGMSGIVAIIPLCMWLIYGSIVSFRSDWSFAGSYFLGWRRKSGLVLLAVCGLMCVGMVRSYYVTDGINAFGGRFESRNGTIERSVRSIIRVGSTSGSTVSPAWNVPYLSLLIPTILASTWLLLSPSSATAIKQSAGSNADAATC